LPKELFEIKAFNRGTISSPSEEDIPPEAAAHSLNVDPNAVDGKLTGRRRDTIPLNFVSAPANACNSEYSCKIMHDSDPSKVNAILYDTDANKIRHLEDLDGDQNVSDLLTGHSMTGDSATFANTSNSHIRLGAGKGTESKWIGYVNHSQFGSAIDGIQIEQTRLSNIETFTTYNKIVSHGSYVYGMKMGGTSIVKHSGSSGEVVGRTDFPFVAIQCLALNINTGNLWVYDLDEVQHTHGILYRLDSSLGVTKTILPTPVADDDCDSKFKARLATIPQMVRNDDIDNGDGSYTSGSSQRPGWYFRTEDGSGNIIAGWDNHPTEKTSAIDNASYVSDLHVYQADDKEIITFSIMGDGEEYTKVKVDGTSGNFKRGYEGGLLFTARITSTSNGAVSFYDATPQSWQRSFHQSSTAGTKRLDGTTTDSRYNKYQMYNTNSEEYHRLYQGWFYPSHEEDNVITFTEVGTNYKSVEHHADWYGAGGSMLGARQMAVMYYPSPMPLSNAFSGYIDSSTYSGNAGHDNQYKSLSWYATTVERTGELKYTDGAVNGSTTGTDNENALIIGGRNWGGQAFMSWTTVASGGNTKFRLTKLRYTLFDIPYVHTLSTKLDAYYGGTTVDGTSISSPTDSNVSAIGDTAGTKGCLFNSGIGVSDLRIEQSWDATLGSADDIHGRIHSLHVSSGTYPVSPATNDYDSKTANIWVRFDHTGTGKLRTLRFQIESKIPYCYSNGNYNNSNGTQTELGVTSSAHFVTNESPKHLPRWSTPMGSIAGVPNDTTLGYILNTETFTPALPSAHYSHLLSGYPTTAGQTHHPYNGTASQANATGKVQDHYTDSSISYNRAFAITGAEQKSLADMTTFHATDPLPGNSAAAAIKKLENATLGQTSAAATTLNECNIIVNPGHLGSGTGFNSSYEYFYRISLVYDEYQESQMTADVQSIISSSGQGFKIFITIKDYATTLPKRVSHINLYRGEAPDHDINKSETLYRLVKKVPLDDQWTDVGSDKQAIVIDAIAERAGITFESNTGVSEVLPHTSLDYGLSTFLNNFLFVSKASGVGLTSLDHYLFRSLPYKYDMFDWSQDFVEMPEYPVALASYGGRVLCFGSNNTYRVEPNNMYIEDTYEGIGCLGDRAHISTEYGLFFCDNNNIYQYTNSVKPIGAPILKNSYDESLGYLELIKTYEKPILAFDANNNALLVSMTKPDNSVTYIYVYTLASNRWDLWDRDIGTKGLIQSGKGGVYATNTVGNSALIHIANDTRRAAFTWVSKIISGQHQSQKKKFYRIDIPYTGVAPTVTYGFDGADPVSSVTPDTDSNITSQKIKDTKRGVQVKITGASTETVDGVTPPPNFIESMGIIMRRFLKLIKATG